ncbi:MAG: 23S rRNA (adenine(2503)-C(2))-methyltransferase RlmN [Verrucomicrobia bacterium]|nr:23S rRNA (adenine(2503)-C(2))-methyltransferase RlmN [Verrucomicrobiota bacterium]
MRFQPSKPSIYGETLTSLTELLREWGEPGFRARQILDWLYRKRVTTFEEMANLPVKLRARLEGHFCLLPNTRLLVKQANDITEKLLLQQEDQRLIETVLISYPQKGVGQEDSRRTICVSSQVGCAYGCKFCASGLAGWKRDLSAAEIVAQYLHIIRLEEGRGRADPQSEVVPFDNVVYMGMGEPLANCDAVLRSIHILNADWGLRFGARRITVSTSGLVPEIRRLAEDPIQFRLAISLHGATNEVRQQIMPINRKYPLEELLPAAEYFAQKHGRMLTLEFILIEQVNDTFEQATELAKIARRLHAHVNLIPYNKVEGLPWIRPGLGRQKAFAKVLADENVSFTIRKEKGHDIDAACGQLRLKTEAELLVD